MGRNIAEGLQKLHGHVQLISKVGADMVIEKKLKDKYLKTLRSHSLFCQGRFGVSNLLLLVFKRLNEIFLPD